jgi:calcineurin-like phosphoesterase family protein
MKIILEKRQNVYFTADSHYSHKNIVKGVTEWEGNRKTRDFRSVGEMNSAILAGINSTVGPDDYLVHLGDWSFDGFDSISEFRNNIICKNVILFLGNHDNHIRTNRDNIQNIFNEVSNYDILFINKPNGPVTDKYQFVCCHFPIASWNGLNRGVPHLHGHVHLPPKLKIHAGRAMDVGVDGNNMKPYSLNEILSIMKDRPKKHLSLPNDHHVDDDE